MYVCMYVCMYVLTLHIKAAFALRARAHSPSPQPQPQPTAHSPSFATPPFLARIPLKSFLHSTILMQSLPYSGLSPPFPRNPYLTRLLYVFVIYFWPKSLPYSTPLTQSLPYSGLNQPFPRNPYLTRPLYVLYSAIVMKSFFYSLFSAHEQAHT